MSLLPMSTPPRPAACRARLLALGTLALAGCNLIPPPSVDATRYYLLTPAVAVAAPVPQSGGLRLGLRTVEIAPYLRRNSLVVRTGRNEVTFPADARWAEPLEQEIGAALRNALMADPAVDRVFLQPFSFEGARDYDLTVRVQQCEGEIEHDGRGFARFSAFWEITTGGRDARLVLRQRFVAPAAAWDGRNFAELTALLSSDVALLAQDLAGALAAVHPAGH